jgi:hypothetical protein
VPTKDLLTVCLEDSNAALGTLLASECELKQPLMPEQKRALTLLRSNAITTLQHVDALLGTPVYRKPATRSK